DALAIPVAASFCLCAAGLLRRRRTAWALTFTLLVAVGLLNLVQEFDVREGALSLAAAGLLLAGRRAFYVRQSRPMAVTIRRLLVLVGIGAAFTLTLILLVVHAEPLASAKEAASLILWQSAPPIPLSDEAGALPALTRLLSMLVVVACAFVVLRRPGVGVEPTDG